MWDWIRSWVQYSKSSQKLGAELEEDSFGDVIGQRGNQSVAAITSSLALDDVGVLAASDCPEFYSNPLHL